MLGGSKHGPAAADPNDIDALIRTDGNQLALLTMVLTISHLPFLTS
jgi:hypothetical protein